MRTIWGSKFDDKFKPIILIFLGEDRIRDAHMSLEMKRVPPITHEKIHKDSESYEEVSLFC